MNWKKITEGVMLFYSLNCKKSRFFVKVSIVLGISKSSSVLHEVILSGTKFLIVYVNKSNISCLGADYYTAVNNTHV